MSFKPNSLLCSPSLSSTVSVFCSATLGAPPTTFNSEQQASRKPGYSAAESITDLRSCSLFGLKVATLKHLCSMRNHPKLVLAVDSSSFASRSLGEFFENTVVPSTEICVSPMFVLSFGLCEGGRVNSQSSKHFVRFTPPPRFTLTDTILKRCWWPPRVVAASIECMLGLPLTLDDKVVSESCYSRD